MEKLLKDILEELKKMNKKLDGIYGNTAFTGDTLNDFIVNDFTKHSKQTDRMMDVINMGVIDINYAMRNNQFKDMQNLKDK